MSSEETIRNTSPCTFRELGIRSMFQLSALRQRNALHSKIHVASHYTHLNVQETAVHTHQTKLVHVEAHCTLTADELKTNLDRPSPHTQDTVLPAQGDRSSSTTSECSPDVLRVQRLSIDLDKATKELSALHQAHFALQCGFKKTQETLEDEKAELELELFATELERDILLKNEEELTDSVQATSQALDATEATLEAERMAKDCALSDLHAIQTKLGTALEVHDPASAQDELSGLQDLDEMATLKSGLVERDLEIARLRAALQHSDERAHTLNKQLEGECEAHRETRNDLGLIIRQFATLTAEKDDTQTKLVWASEAAEEARTTLMMTTWRLSEELDQLKTKASLDGEEAQTQLEDAVSSLEEITSEKKDLEEYTEGLEQTLLAKANRCQELEGQVAQLTARAQLLEKDGDWHTVVPTTAKNLVSAATPPKRTKGDKENARSGLHGINAARKPVSDTSSRQISTC